MLMEEKPLERIPESDPYKTRYHGGPRRHWMNEPHAPLYYRGKYHLFFQGNRLSTRWDHICWGHLISDDTVRWEQLEDALRPTEGTVAPDGIWTGSATLDRNGLPVLFFTAGDLGYRDRGLISNQNIGIAWPKDPEDPELREWIMGEELAVAQGPGQGRPGEFRDPHVWQEADGWYMAVCGGSLNTDGGAVLLFHTDRLEILDQNRADMDWHFLGTAFEMADPEPKYGSSWELPVLMPLEPAEKTDRKYLLFLMPAPPDRADNKVYYYVGICDLKAGRFLPDPAFGEKPRLLDFGDNIFTGPSVMKDPVTGRLCLFSIMQDKRSSEEEQAACWAHCVGLTRNLRLNGEGTDLCVTADPRLETLFGRELLSLENTSLEEAGRALWEIREEQYCLRAEIKAEAPFSLVLQADRSGRGNVFRIDPRTGAVCGWPEYPGTWGQKEPGRGNIAVRDGRVTMDIYVDHSQIGRAHF